MSSGVSLNRCSTVPALTYSTSLASLAAARIVRSHTSSGGGGEDIPETPRAPMAPASAVGTSRHGDDRPRESAHCAAAAMGIPLHCIPDVRHLYNKDALDTTPIDFDTWKQKPPHGHVIAARITLEDPNAGFEPTSGAIQEFNFHSTPDVWGYLS
jgi:hypothetical protein